MSLRSIDHIVPRPAGDVWLIGEFDGVHRRHRNLAERAQLEASGLGSSVVAIVADADPSTKRLTSARRRCELFVCYGASSAFVAPIGRPDEIEMILGPTLERRRPSSIHVDREWSPSIGRDGLRSYLPRVGVHLHESDAFIDADLDVIDAATIVNLLRSGDVAAANAMLGRPYEVTGVIDRQPIAPSTTRFSSHLVRPDANLWLPGVGAYAAKMQVGRRWIAAVADIDPRPGEVGVEVHLAEFDARFVDVEVSLRLLARLRDGPLSPTVIDVVARIHRDLDQALLWFSRDVSDDDLDPPAI